jgi:c(7)-type cytochrome triheme protein
MKPGKSGVIPVYLVAEICIAVVFFLSIFSWKDVQAEEALKLGQQVYDVGCAGCHGSGVLGAPTLDSKTDWVKREQQGFEILLKHAINGFNNMPAKGGNPAFKNEEVKRAVAYMLTRVGFDKYAKLMGKQQSNKKKVEQKKLSQNIKKNRSYKNINRFNRLMKSSSEWNPAPIEDGIHDPENEGTKMLQSPKIAFETLPKSTSGNRVDWVKALHRGEIAPRYDRLDADVVPIVMDLNIVREVKGSMPNVVYPHKQHTKWLDCSNCHPAIFIPEKGANQISMASILLGQQCGVCHGTVAFPVSECRKCHSQKKPFKPVKE